MLDLLVGILHLVVFPGGLFALALGLFLKGCDRRVEARLQRRVGPPLIQPFLDLIKLSAKEVIIPASAVRGAFLAAPVVALGGIAMCAALLLLQGTWRKPGVYTVEELDPDPFLEALDRYGLPKTESRAPALVD